VSEPLVNAMTQAIEGQNLYHGRYGTTPAGSATARAILAHLRDLGWTLAATPAPPVDDEPCARCGVWRRFHEASDGPEYSRDHSWVAATPAPLDVMVAALDGLPRLWWCSGWGTLNEKRHHGNETACAGESCGNFAYVRDVDLRAALKGADRE